MRIVKRGKLPENIEYRGSCPNCHTEYAWREKDLYDGYINDRDGKMGQVKCPLCTQLCWVYPTKDNLIPQGREDQNTLGWDR